MLRSLAEAPDEPPGVPEGVKDLVSRRLSRLAPATVETLTAAAVLGRDFRLATLAAMAGPAGGGAARAARGGPARRRRARGRRRTSTASRSGTRSCARRSTTPPPPRAGRGCTCAPGEALEAAGAPPGELAHHFFAAREVGGAEAAVAHGAEAARQAVAAHAYEEARVAPRAGARRARAGRAARARGAADRARRRALAGERAGRARGLRRGRRARPPPRRARGAGARGARRRRPPLHADRARHRLRRPARGGARRARRHGRARCARGCWRGSPSTSRSRTPATARRGSAPRRWRWPARAGDAGALAAALLGRHAALLDIDHVEERLRGDRRGARGRGAARGGRARRARAALAHLRPRRARRRSRRPGTPTTGCEALAHELHQPLYSHAALAWRGVSAHLNGHFEEAERIARESLRIAEAAGAPEARAFFLTQLFAVRREQGRLAELVEPLERLSRLPGPVGVSWRSTLPFILVEAGEPERARVAYEAVAADDFAAPARAASSASPGSICLAEACAALGDAAGAESLHARLEPHADRLVQTGFSGCWGSVRRFLGLLAVTAGRPEEARAQLRGRARAPRRRSRPRRSSPARAAISASCCSPSASASRASSCSPRRAPRPPSWGWPALAARADVSGAELGAL